jgi:hypothetical protein
MDLERTSGGMEIVAFVIGVVCGAALSIIGIVFSGIYECP